MIHATDASTRGFPYFFVCVCVRPTPALPPSTGASVRLPLATSPANSPPSVTPRSTLSSRRLHLCPQISSTPADSPARGYPTSLPRTSPGIMWHHLLCSLRLRPPNASIYVCDSTASLTRRPLLSQTSVCIPSSVQMPCVVEALPTWTIATDSTVHAPTSVGRSSTSSGWCNVLTSELVWAQ